MPFVTSPDGVRLHYELEGEGPPLLLHLGAAGDGDLWRATGHVDVLSRTHRCILFDHRGHGESDHPEGPAANHVDRFVADVVALLDELQVPATSFWGWSTGVAVGLKAAQDHPERFSKLVLSGAFSGARPSREELDAQSRARVAELAENHWEMMIATFDVQEPEPVPRWAKERIRATDVERYMDWWEGRPDWGWHPADALPRLTQPTLFVVGEKEDPSDTMRSLAGQVRGGRLVRIPGEGHVQAFIRGELVLRHVTAFLDGPP